MIIIKHPNYNPEEATDFRQSNTPLTIWRESNSSIILEFCQTIVVLLRKRQRSRTFVPFAVDILSVGGSASFLSRSYSDYPFLLGRSLLLILDEGSMLCSNGRDELPFVSSVEPRVIGELPMPMAWKRLRGIYGFIRGHRVDHNLAAYEKMLKQINARGSHLSDKSDQQLRALARDLRLEARRGTPLVDLVVEYFGLVREASIRILDLRPYDVQILAALALHQGKLAEMQTGEGKTLAAVLPASLEALTGQGVHILTFNDYLARRDARWMGPLYAFLGLSVGYVQDGMSREERQQAYACDITYATAREVGFDHLRDQLCQSEAHLAQRGFNSVIVDEADSLLIDEARIPLVIASSTGSDSLDLSRVAALILRLQSDQHYATDENQRNVYFTDQGLDALEGLLHVGSLHDLKNLELLTGLHLALHAQVLLKRDRDYIVRQGKIELVDEFTGRVAENRQWPHGLQAATEAKEGLQIQPEGMIRNAITLIHFMEHYQKVAAMTATAQAAADELYKFYHLRTVVIPPHWPCQREDFPDILFSTRTDKEAALVKEIAQVHATGRPVLVGTSSVAESERLAASLANRDVPCHVLNAKNDEEEADIVARAGVVGAVTISTNMAGRGTDIRLGQGRAGELKRVRVLGGLYVIGTNRHESRRIDDQLRGRAGRQGDPGSSRFFVSLEDDLMQRFGLIDFLPRLCLKTLSSGPRASVFSFGKGGKAADVGSILNVAGCSQTTNKPLEARWNFQTESKQAQRHAHADALSSKPIHAEIERAQRIIEDQNFQTRHTLWKYSKMVEDQRKIFAARRRNLMRGTEVASLFEKQLPDRYHRLCTSLGRDRVASVERYVTLYHMDQHWAEYMSQIDLLRKFVHIPSLDGCDPLGEFHRTIIRAFTDMWGQTEADILATLKTLELSGDGDDLAHGLPDSPAATWTYVINDNPLGDCSQRICKRTKDIIRENLLGLRNWGEGSNQ